MAGINKVILVGNLGKDPETKTFDNGRKFAKINLATSESYTDKNGQRQEKTEWHNIVFWGAVADVVEKYLKKGSQIYVEGKLTTRSYEHEGVKKYITEVEGHIMTMLGKATGNSSPREDSPVQETMSTTDDLPF